MKEKLNIIQNKSLILRKIVKKSNNLPMDSSVEELLSKLKKLPPPPQGALELDISLEIDDNQ